MSLRRRICSTQLSAKKGVRPRFLTLRIEDYTDDNYRSGLLSSES